MYIDLDETRNRAAYGGPKVVGIEQHIDVERPQYRAHGTVVAMHEPPSSVGDGGSGGGAGSGGDGSPMSPEHVDVEWELDEMTERQNWNEMLQELSLMYPMQHPLNKTAKSSIQMRIARAKSASREHYNQHVNLFQKDEVVPD